MHSPGPWRQEDGRVYGSDPHMDGEVLICDTAPDGAALTEYDGDNACLIAAAPDMLAALNDICVLRDYPDSRKGRAAAKRGDPFQRAYSAIAKARGQ